MPSTTGTITRARGIEGTLLLQRTIARQIVEPAQKALIFRPKAAIFFGPNEIKGQSIEVDLEDPDTMTVYQVSEGAYIPIGAQAYSTFNLKPLKYGVRPFITEEMLEDSMFPLLKRALNRAGIELAENEDTLIMDNALDNAGNTVSGGAAVTIANMTRAIQHLEDNDFEATDYAVGPEVANDLRNIDTFAEANKFGNREMLQNGFVGTIYGMDVARFSANIGTTTDSYVYDKEFAFVIAEKRPITVKNFSEEQRDMVGATVTQRIAFRQLRANAIAKITSS